MESSNNGRQVESLTLLHIHALQGVGRSINLYDSTPSSESLSPLPSFVPQNWVTRGRGENIPQRNRIPLDYCYIISNTQPACMSSSVIVATVLVLFAMNLPVCIGKVYLEKRAMSSWRAGWAQSTGRNTHWSGWTRKTPEQDARIRWDPTG